MNVIAHRPSFWFFLKDEGCFFLDVNSGSSFVGYSICFQLSPQESERYEAEGEGFIDELAHQVNQVQGPYLERQEALEATARDRVHRAILDWKRGQKP